MKAGRTKKKRSTPLDKVRKPMAPPGKVEPDVKKYRRGRMRKAARIEIIESDHSGEGETGGSKP